MISSGERADTPVTWWELCLTLTLTQVWISPVQTPKGPAVTCLEKEFVSNMLKPLFLRAQKAVC